MALIYHITTATAWAEALKAGQYEAPSLQSEGFIHNCEESQVAAILDRFYADQHDLVKLIIDTDKLSSPLVYEWSASLQDTFPHIYGTINLDAVLEAVPL
ncbi:MAG: DUF952 domain-containing protein [Chitinophagaceae bacterium]|jgi:uncharacterized protein (DUF952 family)|nr:DUF952 domain-containing protein [Chitinophagaceae bacterium]